MFEGFPPAPSFTMRSLRLFQVKDLPREPTCFGWPRSEPCSEGPLSRTAFLGIQGLVRINKKRLDWGFESFGEMFRNIQMIFLFLRWGLALLPRPALNSKAQVIFPEQGLRHSPPCPAYRQSLKIVQEHIQSRFFFGGTGGLNSTQALYHSSHIPSPFVLLVIFLDRVSLFAWVWP
jgi:hypothetical protein